ncbi:hypothetical protein ACFL2H_06415 [Planctomycetota bacterium]
MNALNTETQLETVEKLGLASIDAEYFRGRLLHGCLGGAKKDRLRWFLNPCSQLFQCCCRLGDGCCKSIDQAHRDEYGSKTKKGPSGFFVGKPKITAFLLPSNKGSRESAYFAALFLTVSTWT